MQGPELLSLPGQISAAVKRRNDQFPSSNLTFPIQDDTGQWRDPNNTLTWKFKGEWTGGSNILGLVFFAIILGVALANIGEKGKPLLYFFSSLADAMMTITTWVIKLAPVGVFFLIGGQVLATEDFGTVLNQLGWYFSTVLIGLLPHTKAVCPLQCFQGYLFTDLWCSH